MLSSDEQAKLRAEEVFRQEVRAALDQERGAKRRRSPFAALGTPLGLWFLSVLLLSFGPFVYAELTARRTKEVQRQSTVLRLDTEIAYRLANVRNDSVVLGLVPAILTLEEPHREGTTRYLFLENKERPTSALLWELGEMIPSSEQGSIFVSYQTARALGALRADAAQQKESPASWPVERVQRVALDLQFKHAFNLPRWGCQFSKGIQPDQVYGGLVSREVLEQKFGEPPAVAASGVSRTAKNCPAM